MVIMDISMRSPTLWSTPPVSTPLDVTVILTKMFKILYYDDFDENDILLCNNNGLCGL